MASSSRSRKTTRFSLLLLEDGEVLLSDLAVQYRFDADAQVGSAFHPLVSHRERFPVRSANSTIRGRVKIGTRNMFFDSDDWRDPVIRIPLVSVESAQSTRHKVRSLRSDDNLTQPETVEDSDDDISVVVLANSAVFQRELGTDHPYINVQLKGKHIFLPLYSSSLQMLDEINTLLQIVTTASRRSRDEKLRILVRNRESRVPFDITLLQHGIKENALMDAAASAVYAMSRTPGRFRITSYNVYFMPIHGESAQSVERISVNLIKSIRRLHHGCRDAALEIGFDDENGLSNHRQHPSLMISFPSTSTREKAVGILLKFVDDGIEMFSRRELGIALNKWRRGELSNFDYLMYLNMAAGRSFNDLSQYPVYPWILNIYNSDRLALEDPSIYRDLSKPVGALNPERLAVLTERFEEMSPPRFFYGTHYSTPAYTINYLLRAAPAAMLRLQNGKFDMPDRLFHSLLSTWDGVLSNHGDVKELIPEFFTLNYSGGESSGVVPSTSSPGEFLDNVLGLDLGTRQDGKRVDDVELPPWANGSSELFVRRHRDALESDYVSMHLHVWVDLIFGIKSGNAEAKNIFYTDVVVPDSIEDTSGLSAEEVAQIETVYLEFGRTPQRIFGHPHPPRFGDLQTSGTADTTRAEESLATHTRKAWSINEKQLHAVACISDPNKMLCSPEKGASPPTSSLNAWGARSRRRNSVLSGASDHILVSYEPSGGARELREVQNVTSSHIVDVVDPVDSLQDNAEILDFCLAEEPDGSVNSTINSDNDVPILCTIWSNGYLKVHGARSTLRTKHVGEVCSLAYIPGRLVCYGSPTGSIGLYYIETGRTEEIEPAAHDAAIYALDVLSGGNLLLSGSKDASVKLWRFIRHGKRQGILRLLCELDAESPVDDLSGSIVNDFDSLHNTEDGDEQTVWKVAAATSDGQLLAWEVNISNRGNDFPEPLWRNERSDLIGNWSGNSRYERVRNITWLYRGESRKHVLASVHFAQNCVRVWSLEQTNMASAEVVLSDECARCITSSKESRTILVGGAGGQVSEFDSTGLCLGRITTGTDEVRGILLQQNGECMYILAGQNRVLRVNR